MCCRQTNVQCTYPENKIKTHMEHEQCGRFSYGLRIDKQKKNMGKIHEDFGIEFVCVSYFFLSVYPKAKATAKKERQEIKLKRMLDAHCSHMNRIHV